MRSPGEVCSAHGLHVAPDGRCVLCRRTESRAPERSWVLYWLAGMIPLGALFAWAALRSGPASAEGPSVDALEVPPGPAPRPSASSSASPSERSLGEETVNVREQETPTRPSSRMDEPRLSDAREKPSMPGARSEPPTGAAERAAEPTPEDLKAIVARVPVRLYSAPWCGYCTKTREFLRSNGVSVQEFDVESDANAKARARELNPKGGVPVLEIDQDVIVGFAPERMASALARAVERRTGLDLSGSVVR